VGRGKYPFQWAKRGVDKGGQDVDQRKRNFMGGLSTRSEPSILRGGKGEGGAPQNGFPINKGVAETEKG